MASNLLDQMMQGTAQGFGNIPAPQQGGFNFAGITQDRNQKFLNMYTEKLVSQMQNANGINVSGEHVSYEGSVNAFPTLEESWNDYRTEANNRMIQPDYASFKQLYDTVNQQYQNFMAAQIGGLAQSGVSTKAIHQEIKNNPNFKQHLQKLAMKNPELAASIQQFMPSKSLHWEMQENPNYYRGLAATAGLGTMAGLAYFGGAPAGQASEIAKKYAGKISTLQTGAKTKGQAYAVARQELKDAQAALAKANKSKAKTKKSMVAKAKARVAAAQKDLISPKAGLASTKKTYQKSLQDLKMTRDKLAKQSRWGALKGPKGRWGGMGQLGKFGVGAGAYAFGPMAAQMGIEGFTGSEELGKFGGQVAQTGVSGAMTYGSLKGGLKTPVSAINTYVKQKGKTKLFKLIAKKAGPKMALKMLGKGMLAGIPFAGAAISGAFLYSDLQAIHQWIKDDLGTGVSRLERAFEPLPGEVRKSTKRIPYPY